MLTRGLGGRITSLLPAAARQHSGSPAAQLVSSAPASALDGVTEWIGVAFREQGSVGRFFDEVARQVAPAGAVCLPPLPGGCTGGQLLDACSPSASAALAGRAGVEHACACSAHRNAFPATVTGDFCARLQADKGMRDAQDPSKTWAAYSHGEDRNKDSAPSSQGVPREEDLGTEREVKWGQNLPASAEQAKEELKFVRRCARCAGCCPCWVLLAGRCAC